MSQMRMKKSQRRIQGKRVRKRIRRNRRQRYRQKEKPPVQRMRMRAMIGSQMKLMHLVVQAKMRKGQEILSSLMEALVPMMAKHQSAVLGSWMNQRERRSQKGIS